MIIPAAQGACFVGGGRYRAPMELFPELAAARRRYLVEITVRRGGWLDPDPAVYAARAQKAAAGRAVDGVISAHTAAKVITAVTVDAADQASAAACGLAVVAEALGEDVAGAQVLVREG